MELKEALSIMDGWHHAILDEEQARETLEALGLGKEVEDTLIKNCAQTVAQGEDTVILHPIKPSEKYPANGFICQNDDCTMPQGVWVKDWLYNVIPFAQVKYCPVCGSEKVGLVHAFEKGEEQVTINGNWLVGAITYHLSLPTESFMGRGYQHRENMRALRKHFGEEVQSGDSAK